MAKTKTDKFQNEKIRSSVLELYSLQLLFKKQKEEYEKKKNDIEVRIRNYMFVNGFDRFHFLNQEEDKDIKVCNVKRRSVSFDIPKMEQKLDAETLSKFLLKKYYIKDFKDLVKYLKSCGVDKKKFLSFIECEKSVDTKELDRLGDIGEINISDLKGCYEVTENIGYIKITESDIEDVSMNESGG